VLLVGAGSGTSAGREAASLAMAKKGAVPALSAEVRHALGAAGGLAARMQLVSAGWKLCGPPWPHLGASLAVICVGDTARGAMSGGGPHRGPRLVGGGVSGGLGTRVARLPGGFYGLELVLTFTWDPWATAHAPEAVGAGCQLVGRCHCRPRRRPRRPQLWLLLPLLTAFCAMPLRPSPGQQLLSQEWLCDPNTSTPITRSRPTTSSIDRKSVV